MWLPLVIAARHDWVVVLASTGAFVLFLAVYVRLWRAPRQELRFENGRLTLSKRRDHQVVALDEIEDMTWFVHIVPGTRVSYLCLAFLTSHPRNIEVWRLGNLNIEVWPVLALKSLVESIQQDLRKRGSRDFPLQNIIQPLQHVVPGIASNVLRVKDPCQFLTNAVRDVATCQVTRVASED